MSDGIVPLDTPEWVEWMKTLSSASEQVIHIDKIKHRFLVRFTCLSCQTYHYRTYHVKDADTCGTEAQTEQPDCIKCHSKKMCYTIYGTSLMREIVT